MGSLGSGTTIENILYRDIYNVGGNQMFMYVAPPFAAIPLC